MYPKLFKEKYKRGTFRLKVWNYGGVGSYFITICTEDRKHFFGKIENGKMIPSEIGKMVHEEWQRTPIIRPDMNIELFDFVIMPDHFHGIIRIGVNQYNSEIIIPDDSNKTGDSDYSGDSDDSRSRAMNRAATGDVTGTGDIPPTNIEDQKDFPTENFNSQLEPDVPDIFSETEIPLDLEELIEIKQKSKNKFGPQSKNLASIMRGFKSAVTTKAKKTGSENFAWQSRFHEYIIREEKVFRKIQKYINNNPAKWIDKREHWL